MDQHRESFGVEPICQVFAFPGNRRLIHGARSVLTRAKEPGPWVEQISKRRPRNVVIVALANKMARTHCHAGKRRSAAVALYVADRLGATLSGPHPDDPNRTVLALLRDPAWGLPPARRRPWWAIWT